MSSQEHATGGRKPLIVGALALLGALGLALGLAFGTGSSDPYRVRAIFDDASNLVVGEQVKVAGVPVGSIEAVEPTPQAKAAVVFNVTRAGFKDFRTDASCTIEPQSLLGENFVDCLPTQAHAEGAPLPPPLSVIPGGREGAGERLLPLANTSSPVAQDVITDINHLPERERFRIILNELGAGLEGNGEALHEVIQRADPALRETNRVLAILAADNHVLAKLAVDSQRALAPLAEVRKRVADYLVRSNEVARASAHNPVALGENFKDFPAFLEELGPAMERIGHFGEETAPVMRELGLAAPGLNRLFAAIPAFSEKSTTYFESLGRFGKTAGPDLQSSEVLLNRLLSLGAKAQPFAGNLSQLLSSFRETGGIERLMDFIFLVAGATNGYNSLGHFLRADAASLGLCAPYVAQTPRCKQQFSESAGSSSAATATTASHIGLPTLASTQALLQGAHPGAVGRSSRLLLNYLLGE
ncbi:MAG TPA: MlaD family protein [Solirubrobacteraceae bacterium]|nr:MlaD family protein [Solirubrobacteraceae bacterium]